MYNAGMSKLTAACRSHNLLYDSIGYSAGLFFQHFLATNSKSPKKVWQNMKKHRPDHPEATKQTKYVCQTMQESIGCDMLQGYDLTQPLKVCKLILMKSSKFSMKKPHLGKVSILSRTNEINTF